MRGRRVHFVPGEGEFYGESDDDDNYAYVDADTYVGEEDEVEYDDGEYDYVDSKDYPRAYFDSDEYEDAGEYEEEDNPEGYYVDVDEHEDDLDRETWDKMMEHEAAANFFGLFRGRKKKPARKKTLGPHDIEFVKEVLEAQGTRIADSVWKIAMPIIEGLTESLEKAERKTKEAIEDLVDVRKDIDDIEIKVEYYRTMADDCLAREVEHHPSESKLGFAKDKKDLDAAAEDVLEKVDDAKVDIVGIGSSLLKSAKEQDQAQKNVVALATRAAKNSIRAQEARVRRRELPKIPPISLEPPALPPRDPVMPTREPPPIPRAKVVSMSREDAEDVQETTLEIMRRNLPMINAIRNIVDDERTPEEIAEDDAREALKEAEWEIDFPPTDSKILRRNTLKSTQPCPVYARMVAMQKRHEKERKMQISAKRVQGAKKAQPVVAKSSPAKSRSSCVKTAKAAARETVHDEVRISDKVSESSDEEKENLFW